MSLTQAKIEEIERKAQDVLVDAYDAAATITPPVDVQKILRRYGLQLKSGPFEKEEIAGAYDRNEKTIYVSEDDSYTRQVFTVAHELGHFILHKDKEAEVFYRVDAIRVENSDNDTIEQEANWFAASLLMPHDALLRYWEVVTDIEQLARLFGVSNSAMDWRLKNLGVRPL